MHTKNLFRPLLPDIIKDMTDVIEVARDLISITLTDGGVLIGSLANHWKWNGKFVTIRFNTDQGKRFGDSHLLNIPLALIANIQKIPLDEKSIPKLEHDDPQIMPLKQLGIWDERQAKLPVHDYPNPLAKIISRHNLRTAKEHDLPLLSQKDRALSKDAIPPNGLFFTQDFLFYADWKFFSSQLGGASSVGAGVSLGAASANIQKDLNPSLNDFVIRKLRSSWLARSIRKVSKQTQDTLLHGCILLPDPSEDTIIEGEKCIVALCAISDEKEKKVGYPVLLKLDCLKFPVELLGKVHSILTFYGELLPIPLNFMGRQYQAILLARAMAFLLASPNMP